MIKLKFLLNKNIKHTKIFNIISAKSQHTSKYNTNLKIGYIIPTKKLISLKYSTVINLLKLGSVFSKQYSLNSFFYLKKLLKTF